MNKIDNYIPDSEYGLCFFDEGGMHERDGKGFTREQMREAIEAAILDERQACARECYVLILFGPVSEAQQRYNKAYEDCASAIMQREHP